MKRLLIILSPLLLLLQGCEFDDISNFELMDPTGVEVQLQWQLLESLADPIDQANLDLRATRNGAVVEFSTLDFNFESVQLINQPNGIYDLEVTYFEGNVDLEFFITITGLSSGTQLSTSGVLRASDSGITIIPISIFKSGNTFELN